MSAPSYHRTCWCGSPVTQTLAGDVCTGSQWHDPTKRGPLPLGQVATLYVAGPMSNLPDNNYPAFNEAAERLRKAGYLVVNPAEYGAPQGARVGYHDLLREDLRQMLACDAVATLPGWEHSNGARNEVNVAGVLAMHVRTVSAWLLQAQRNAQ